jgi:hypothetical protein
MTYFRILSDFSFYNPFVLYGKFVLISLQLKCLYQLMVILFTLKYRVDSLLPLCHWDRRRNAPVLVTSDFQSKVASTNPPCLSCYNCCPGLESTNVKCFCP